MNDIERIVPAARADIVSPDMAGPRALGRFTLEVPAPYLFLESRRERFGWLADPSAHAVTHRGKSGILETGPLHWYIRLRSSRSGWRVDKPMKCTSMDEAREMAMMEWAGREGYLVDVRIGVIRLGPQLGDLADPVRYLDLVKSRLPR